MVSRSEALFLRLFDVGHNLIVLKAYCLREGPCKGLYGSPMRLFSALLVPSLRGSTAWLVTHRGKKGQGRFQSFMTSDMKVQAV